MFKIVDKVTKRPMLLCRTEAALKIALECVDVSTVEVIEVDSYMLNDPMEQ